MNMTDTKNENYMKLLDSATLIAILTGCFYLFGYEYYDSFFHTLSIPAKFIDFHPLFYVVKSLDLFLNIIFIIILFFFVQISYPYLSKSKNRILEMLLNYEHYYSNLDRIATFLVKLIDIELTLVIFGIYSLFFLYSLIFYSFLSHLDQIGIISSVVVLAFLASQFNISFQTQSKSIIEIYTKNKKIILFILLLYTLLLSNSLGCNDAMNFIKGDNPDAFHIELSLKDKNSIEFQNKTLLLAMIHNNEYYIIEENETSNGYPKLYIIASDQIATSTITRNNNTFQESFFKIYELIIKNIN